MFRPICRTLITLCLALLAGYPAVTDISAVDGRGKRVTLAAPPQRIVSLSPGTTEMLFAIGLKGRIVADTTYCDYPREARLLPHIGDVTVSVEKVLNQNPDLVVASGSANRTAIPVLERLDLPVFAVDPRNIRETYAALRMLGQITGQAAEAARVMRTMQSGLQAVQKSIPGPPARPKVLWVIQSDPLVVVGGESFMDDLITLAGGENLGRAAGKGWPTLSPERVVVLAPDVILAGRETAERVRQRAGWDEVPAVARGRVVTLSADEAVRPGPRLVVALKKVMKALYPAHRSPRR